MDGRKAFLILLVIYVIDATVAWVTNDGGGFNNIRRIRRIGLNEYLVPPPLPSSHLIRTGRLANYQPTEAPGYIAQLMGWFGFGTSSQLPPPPPPPPSPPPSPHLETSYSTSFIQPPPPPLGSSTVYSGASPAVYDKPPLPPPSLDGHPRYPQPTRAKSCNSCNKVPWIPVQNDELSHSQGDASFVPPPPSPPQLPLLNGDYLPPRNHEAPHDAHHAASQEVRAPDFSFVAPTEGQDGSFSNPFSNLHLHPEAIPPLYKAETFNYPVQSVLNENPGFELDAPPPFVSGDGVSTGNGTFLDIAEPNFNSGHNGQSVYPAPSSHSDLGVIHQEVGYTNPGASNGEFEHFGVQDGTHNDLSSSGTQVSHDHANLTPDKQGLEDIVTHQGSLDPVSHQTSFGNSGILDHQSSGVSSNGEYYDVTGPNGLSDLGNSSQIDQHPPSSYGFSDLDRVPNNFEQRYNDLSSNGNVAKASYASSRVPDKSAAKSEDSIHFEESPLLDFTHKGESRTDSSSIPPTSNAFADFERAEITTTLPPGDEIFGTRQGAASTETVISSEINDNATRDINTLVKPYDQEILNQNVEDVADTTSIRQQGAKKDKQVIIPYTSQYTPLPFHPSHVPKVSYTSNANHNNYTGEESRNRIKVASPDSSHTIHFWDRFSILESARKPAGTKVNNSIDVHRLQKNIDNWTIQKYAKGTTASTVSPSLGNPYLFPSKQIPDEYLRTTESVNHMAGPDNDNVKSFTLGGFSFNDLEYKDSASNRVEGPRIRVVQVGNTKSIESSTDASIASTKNDNMWQGYSVDISPVNKERVYVVTPQPIVTTTKSTSEQKKEKEAERNSKELRKTSEANTKTNKKNSDTFESIEKAYQVLPQAVNNLAVASTGPESVRLWDIMEHENFASLDDSENDDDESPEIPVLYVGHSKVSRAGR